MDLQPHDYTPDLAPDRLAHLASVPAIVRRDLLREYDRTEGDGPWSFGCRVYERSCWVFETESANRSSSSWLRVHRNGLECVLLVGDGQTPLRFYTGEHENPPRRVMRRRLFEQLANQLAFDSLSEDFCALSEGAESVWRLAVEADNPYAEIRTFIVRCSVAGSPLNAWEVPHNGHPGRLAEQHPR